MNYLKLALLFVICIQQNFLLAGACQTREVDDEQKKEFMLKTAQSILNSEVVLVPADFDFYVPDQVFNDFITKIKRLADNEALLRAHFSAGRAQGLLYTRCRIPLPTIKRQCLVTLGKLLPDLSDPELKKEIICRVMEHNKERGALIASAPRGKFERQTVPFALDIFSQEMSELLCTLEYVTIPAQ